MAGGEEIFADIDTVGRVGDQNLLNDTATEQITGLVQAHHGYEDASELHQDDINRLRAEIDERVNQKEALEEARATAISAQDRLRHDFSYTLSMHLQNGEAGINPIYAAALLAPGLDQGSLWYPNTLAAADQLGRNLVVLSESLATSTEPMPVAAFRYSEESTSQRFTRMRVDYGYTKPGEGLVAHVVSEETGACSCGSPHFEIKPFLEIPTVAPTLAAVEVNGWRYMTSNGKVVSIREGGNRVEQVADISPNGQVPSIPLPTGNLYESHHPLVLYDKDEEDVELSGPRKFLSRDETLCAIGERAIKTTLVSLYNRVVSAEQKPELFKDMALFVATALGIAIKDQDFKTAQKIRQS